MVRKEHPLKKKLPLPFVLPALISFPQRRRKAKREKRVNLPERTTPRQMPPFLARRFPSQKEEISTVSRR